jgi:acetyl-CoA acetyltransferase
MQSGASEPVVAVNLGLRNLTFWGGVDYGGTSSVAIVAHAAMAVATGAAKYVLCYRAVNGRSGARPGTSDTYELIRGADPSSDNFLVPFGLTAPGQAFALLARRHMDEFGTTEEQLGQIAVTLRGHANHYPSAQMFGRPLTIDEYLEAPTISDPLRKFDFCLQSDGAAAVLVTTPERAASLRSKPVFIAGAVQASRPDLNGPLFSNVAQTDVTSTSGAVAAVALYGLTGFKPSDIDVAQLYDCFTITALLQIEEYGFCAKGEAGAFVESAGIGVKGALPVNTDGGNLSAAYIQGMNHVLEGVRQLRGESTSQVPGAEVCLVTAAIPNPTSAMILTGAPT